MRFFDFSKKIFIFIIIITWVFSGWSQILPLGELRINKIRILPEIKIAQAATTVTYTRALNTDANGYGSWTVPEGVSSAIVACWGGGGGGADASNAGGGGGGGGAFASSTFSVTAGTEYTIYIAGQVAETTNGQNSTFGTTTMIVAGGKAGGAASPYTGGAGGAVADTTCNGVDCDVEKAGGTGGAGSTTGDVGGGGGGAGGPHANGVNGQDQQTNTTGGAGGAGDGGSPPGGAGGAGGNDAGAGGNGVNGSSNTNGGGGGGGSDDGDGGGTGGIPGGGGGGADAASSPESEGASGQCTVTYTAITAALTGTVTASITETDIVAGGKTIILTLTGDTWIAAGATFDAQRQNIINGIDSAQAEGTGWDAEVKAKEVVGAVVRTNDTVVTITLTAQAGYNITVTETITATIPTTALVAGNAIVATPTFDIATVATLNQSAYRFFNNTDSTSVGAVLADVNASTTLSSTGANFRLRALLDVEGTTLSPGTIYFKLQTATSTLGNCTSTLGNFVDVSPSSGDIRFYDNATPVDGALLTATSTDPIYGIEPVTNQLYLESNNLFTATSSVTVGFDGKWDFSLKDYSAPANQVYCFRIVKSDNSLLDSYMVIPQIMTASASSLSLSLSTSTVSLGILVPGAPNTATSSATVIVSGLSDGYYLSVKRDDVTSTLDLSTDATVDFPDYTAWTYATPNSTTTPGSTFSFRTMQTGTDSNYNSTWWGSDDIINAKYAGFPVTSQQIMNCNTGGTCNSGTTVTVIKYRADSPTSQVVGSYDGAITITALAP